MKIKDKRLKEIRERHKDLSDCLFIFVCLLKSINLNSYLKLLT